MGHTSPRRPSSQAYPNPSWHRFLRYELQEKMRCRQIAAFPHQAPSAMRSTQPCGTPEHNCKSHPEGSVLKHVLLVVDLASEYKKYSNDEKVFMWAALLHDIGKLTTTRVRKNRITSYNHDTEGKDIAMNILNELTDDEEFKQKVSKLVRWHMQPLFYDKNLPFFQPQDMINDVEYKEVALLSLCDRLGRGNLDEDRIKEEKERIESFKAYFEK